MSRFSLLLALIALSTSPGVLSSLTVSAAAEDENAWPFVGNSIQDTRSTETAPGIGTNNVARLVPVWRTHLKGAVSSATPVSDGQSIFIPTAIGLLYQIDQQTGQITREIDLAKVLEIPGAFSKASVGVSGNKIVLGLKNKPLVAALDKRTGALLWKTTIDGHPQAAVNQSPLVVGDRVFIGVSGEGEEIQATSASYQCCSFRGSEVALDATSGRVLWKRYVLPPGFAGASLWSGSAAYDPKRHSLYITTGNAFRVPNDVQKCADKNKNNLPVLAACYPPGVWYDSILSLDPDTGAIKWGRRFESYDIYTGACGFGDKDAITHCGNGPDFDFSNGAMLWRQQSPSGPRDLVGAGQKSGMFWALDPNNGRIVWSRSLGPAGLFGGVGRGSAADGKRIYATETDKKFATHDPEAYSLPSGQVIKYGSFAALDSATGKILWQVPDPAGVKFPGTDIPCKIGGREEDCSGAFPTAPVTVANGVLYGCSEEPEGHIYAFDATSGALLWTFKPGAKCTTGASIIDRTVYWAVGQTLYAFSVSGNGTVDVGQTNLHAGMNNAPTVWNGIYSSAQAERGREIYRQSCASGCHLDNLTGSGQSPELTGHDFLTRWDGLSVDDLLQKIHSTMPKPAPGSLSADDYLAVVSYLFSANKFPAGRRDLRYDAATLRQTKITFGK